MSSGMGAPGCGWEKAKVFKFDLSQTFGFWNIVYFILEFAVAQVS
jgi:hypothetical protein